MGLEDDWRSVGSTRFDLLAILVEMVWKEIRLVVRSPNNLKEVNIGRPLSLKLGIHSLWKV
jgi:hypothetical protein